MNVISLPEYLKIESLSPIQMYDYNRSNESLKQMIDLTQNTFSFLLEGTKEVITDKQTISIQNSSFLLMKSGHCLMTEKLFSSANTYRSMLLFFSNSALLEFIRKHNIHETLNKEKASIFDFKYDAFLIAFVNSLKRINTLPKTVRDKLIQVKFEELMLYLIETNGSSFLFSLITERDSLSINFITIIESNKLNKLSLKELAFLSNMSVSTFKRKFEEHYEEPPSKWFQDKRLEHAAFLLKNESKRPSDIYDAIGYENLSNFIFAFKAKFGITPKQYQSS